MHAPENDETVERVADVLAITSRRMFGGVGLYHDDVFFALVDEGRLYLRVDAATKPRYVAEGCEAFRPFPNKPSMESYWEPPRRVLASRQLLRAWSEDAVAAARAKAGEKSDKRVKRRRAIPNLGPRSRRWLREVGVRTLEELRERGSVATFRALQAKGRAPTMLVLEAMEAAIMELRTDQLPDAVKASLRERAGVVGGRVPRKRGRRPA